MTTEKAVNRCTEKTLCPGMIIALAGGGARQIGIHHTTLMNMDSGDCTSRLAYRLPKKVDGNSVLLMNFCPWCGEKVKP
jgi:hypothetical protein